LLQAREEVNTAQANLHLSEITAERYTGLFKTDSVAKQDVDNAVQDAAAKMATVKSAQANVARLEQLVAFEKIYVPFDGIVTARRTDVGQLIESGSSGGAARELFHVAAIDRLRVFVNVPQDYSHDAKIGMLVDLTLPEIPAHRFPGTLVRTAGAIDPATRTLTVEVDVSNSTGVLFRRVHRSALQDQGDYADFDYSLDLHHLSLTRLTGARRRVRQAHRFEDRNFGPRFRQYYRDPLRPVRRFGRGGESSRFAGRRTASPRRPSAARKSSRGMNRARQ
jgi:hypothetical protein